MDKVIINNEIILAVKLLFIISILKLVEMGLRKLCGFAVFFPNKPKNVTNQAQTDTHTHSQCQNVGVQNVHLTNRFLKIAILTDFILVDRCKENCLI